MDDKLKRYKRHSIPNSCNECATFKIGIKLLNWLPVAAMSTTIICLVTIEPSKSYIINGSQI
jgi:hypothetical protein